MEKCNCGYDGCMTNRVIGLEAENARLREALGVLLQRVQEDIPHSYQVWDFLEAMQRAQELLSAKDKVELCPRHKAPRPCNHVCEATLSPMKRKVIE